jgi:gliding motility-associated-like protein
MINTIPLNIYKSLHRLIFLAMLFVGSKSYSQCATVQSSFTISPTELCTFSKSNNFTVTNTSSGSAANTASYKWYIYDPTIPSTSLLTTWPKNPGMQTLINDGEGDILLVAYDAMTGCYDTSRVRVVISEPPTASFTFNNNNQCAGTVITFTNTSAKVYPYTTYLWDFGDGTTSTVKNPTHSYALSGSYSVTVKTTNHPGCEAVSAAKTVTVTTGPVASFTFDNNQCANNLVTFTNTSTNTNGTTTYAWDFGDGGTSTAANPTHTYLTANTYNVELTVTNGVCSNTSLSVITIINPPTSSFTFTNNNQCAGTVIDFTNTSTKTNGTTTYTWDFGDLNTSTLENPSHAYAAAGTYTVTLTVANTATCKTISLPTVITVTSSPVAAFTFTNNNQCAGTVIAFTNTSVGTTGSSTYDWNFGDGGTSTLPNPTHTYAAGGSYSVMLTVKNGTSCINVSPVTTITVKATPVATFTFNSSSCTSTSVSFTNTSTTTGAAGTYLWTFGDGNTSTLENPTNLYAINGTFNVTLKVTNAATGCSNTSAISKITVGSLPPVLSFTMGALTGCSPRTVTFTNTSTGAVPASNFDWDFGNGNTLTGIKDPPAQLYHAGSWTIRLISGNACGIDTLYKTIVIDTLPKAKIIAKPLKGCLPMNFTALNNSTGGNLKYQWFVNGVLTDTTKIISNKTFLTASNTVQLKITNSCGTDDTTLTITSSPKVETVISPLKSTICSASNFMFTYTQITTGDSLNYYWDFGNGNTSTLANPPAETFLNPGTYDPILIVVGRCGSDTSIAHLQVYPIPPLPTISDTTICIGTSVTLNAKAPGEKYEWFDKPGGTLLKVGNGFKTPVLTATATYYVQSTIYDCSSPLKAVTVKVKPVPLPPTVTNDTICAGEKGVLTATGPGGVQFEWFPSITGGAILDSVPVYTTPPLTVTTNYFVQTKLNGCASTRTKAIVKVNPIPVAPTALPVGICSGSTATLTATAPGGIYTWYTAMTGGTLLNTGASYTTPVLTTDTAFYVESKSLSCVGLRKRVPVTVTPAPVVDISADLVSGCAGAEVNFTNNSTTGGIYNWSFSGGSPATSNLYTPLPVKFNTPGNQLLVYLKVNMAGCIKNDSVRINIEAYPKAKVQLSINEGCSPVTVLFTNLSSTKIGHTYFWDLDNGITSTLSTPPAQTYSATGLDKTYTTTLLVTTPAGCKDSTTAEIKVHNNPIAAFKPAANKACVNEGVVFTSESLGALSWKWYFGDGQTSTDKIPVHPYLNPGTYTIKLVVTGSFGCVDSITHDVVINPNPISSYTATTNCNSFPTQFTDQSTGAIQWKWDFGDASPVDNTTSPIHIFPNPGTFDVLLTVTNVFGCIDTSLQKITVLEQPTANFSFKNICAKQTVKFDDLTVGKNLVSWDWDFGDGITSTSQNTSHVYPIAGQYPVSLIVKNTSGCLDTVIKTVMVSTIPTPLFKANMTCLGKITSFTDLSKDSVAITKWFYDFGDGNNSISKNPNYVYSNPGIYNVSLTVTNINGCDSTYTFPVTVDVVPKANYTADTICINNPTTFKDISAGNVIKWEWDFGDGAKDTVGPITSHIYATSGSFLTSLKIYTVGGCTDEKFKMVIVRSDVKAGIIIKDTACVNELIFMKDNSTSVGAVISSSWDFGDGSPVVFSTNTSHAYTTAGLFMLTHTVIGIGGCENRVTDTVFISAAPEADFTSANTCIGQESIFTDKSKGPPTSWSWNFSDGSTSTIQNPKHIYIKAGAYNVKLTVQTGLGCTDTVAKRIIVYSDPKASFTANVSCWGDSTNFINTSNPMDGAIIKTWWNFDDGTTSTVFNPNHILITQKDSFNVKLVIITSHGCMDTVTQVVKTFPIPEFKFSAAATSGCNPFTTSFHDTSTVAGGTIVNWLWNFGDKSLTYKNNPSHTYTVEGKFFVSLTITSSYGCRMTDTLKYPIMVYPRPIAEFTAVPDQASMYEPTIKLIDESQKATLWDWDLGDNTTSVDQYLSHTYADTGTYVITQVAINKYGCRDTIQHSIRINGEPTMFIPNAFTPDGNGINDIFIPKMYGVREFNMAIYDRYGNLIFASIDKEIGWNGKVNGSGETVKDDVYIYKIYVRDLMSNPHTYKGTITVIKKTDKD